MGQFKAFKAADDQPENELNTSDNKAYYKKILEDAIVNFQLSDTANNKNDPQEDASKNKFEFEDSLKEIWKGYEPIILGYIKADNYHAKSLNSIQIKIAEEEKKYYYKWIDSNYSPAKNAQGNEILNKLKKLSILIYEKIRCDYRKLSNHLTQQEAGKNQTNIVPIVISEAYFQKGNDKYYGVYINPKAKALYLDTVEDTNAYQYKKENNHYKTIKTWVYDISTSDHQDWYDPNSLDKRYLYYLGKYINKWLGKSYRKKTEDAWLSLINDSNQQEVAKQRANNQARILPVQWKCFYYEDKDELKSFLSSVSIAEGSGGLSGYAMRADKVSEVDYRWSITANSDEDKHLAKLLSYIMGLERDKFDDENRITISDGKTDGFFPTNWPSDVTGRKSLFHYYKKFLSTDRRNQPAQPAPPRISHSDANSYSYKYDGKQDFKLNNTSYRIWKKGTDFTGEELKKADQERQDAGSVMAAALNQFQFYLDLVSKPDTKATNAKLPATAFAKYVVVNDDMAKMQWVNDTEVKDKNTINQGSVNTDQEWCHLFGHGDGGSEELGNFVSGSKHCNTEQLAIETGQRRISQNEKINKDVELKARITAYLMPNEGAWISKEKTKVKESLFDKKLDNNKWKKLLFGKKAGEDITDSADKELWDDFFESNDNGNYTENQLKNLHKKLSDAIRQKNKDEQGLKERDKLFLVRRKLENEFFLYLPLGRWMR